MQGLQMSNIHFSHEYLFILPYFWCADVKSHNGVQDGVKVYRFKLWMTVRCPQYWVPTFGANVCPKRILTADYIRRAREMATFTPSLYTIVVVCETKIDDKNIVPSLIHIIIICGQNPCLVRSMKTEQFIGKPDFTSGQVYCEPDIIIFTFVFPLMRFS